MAAQAVEVAHGTGSGAQQPVAMAERERRLGGRMI